jgi:hypothetical protein
MSGKRKKASTPMYGEAGYRRLENEKYFTLDSVWIVPALLSRLDLRGPVYEPCAGKGHLVDELRAAGFQVRATDLFSYGREDIVHGVDLFALTTNDLAGSGSIVANFPYDVLDAVTAHILEIAKPLGLQVASLVRSEWGSAKARRELLHENPYLDRLIFLSKRPRWIEKKKKDKTDKKLKAVPAAIGHNSGEPAKKKKKKEDDSPRHYFTWVVFDFSRDTSQPPTIHWAGPSQ